MLSGQSRSGRQVAAQYLQGQQQGRQFDQQQALARQQAQGTMQGQQLQNQRSAMELGLLDQLLSAEGPENQGRLIAQLRALRGQQEPRRDTALEQARMKAVSDLFAAYNKAGEFSKEGQMPSFQEWVAPAMAMMGQQQAAQQGGQQAGNLAVVVRNPKTGKTLYQDAAGNYFTD